jgi:hypothetical protein
VDSRAERAAKNEALFREVNERVKEVAEGFGSDTVGAVCECSSPTCGATIQVTFSEYEAVRAHGDRFALLEGHEDLSIERVIDGNERFILVEKIGEGAAVARDLDPRA